MRMQTVSRSPAVGKTLFQQNQAGPDVSASGSTLREQIENKRKASFKGYDTFLARVSFEILREGAYFSEVNRNLATWAQTYRGYQDEDSFYELIAKLQERLAVHHQKVGSENREDFVNGIYKIIDETFPQK